MGDDLGFRQQLTAVGENLASSFAHVAPKLLLAFVLLLVGLIIALGAERLTRTVLRRTRIESAISRLGINRFLESTGFKGSFVDILARIVFLLVLIVFAQTAVDLLGLRAISEAVHAIIAYLPKVLGAILIILIGSWVARVLGQVVERAAAESGVTYAAIVRQIVTAIVVFAVVVMAVSQLAVDTEVVISLARIALAGAALGTALTFGLGTREATRNLVAGFYLRKLLRRGEHIEVQGCKGTLLAVTPVQTVIETDDQKTKILANSRLLREVTKDQSHSN